MKNAVDEFFTVHAPCKATVQVLKKLMTVLKCLLKDLFKGEIGSFRAAGIGVPRLFVSVHIIMFIRQIILIELLLMSGEDWQSAFNPVSQQMIKTVVRAQMNVLTLHIADACTDFIRGDPVLVSGLDRLPHQIGNG